MKVDVGFNCYIDSKWIPKDIPTGLYDINGIEIKTSDRITLTGCSYRIAIVGRSEDTFKIYFGSDNGSIRWDLNQETITSHNIRVLKK